MILRKSQAEIEGMARAGDIVADTLAMIADELSPGVSMLELDRLAEEYIRERGGVPTSKGYRGYPATLCISPNAMIVHGIPTDYRAEPGDVVSVDLGVTLDGLIADSAYTFGVGEISPEAQRLLDVCQEALGAGIEQARVGSHVSDVGHTIQTVVEAAGFSVVRSLVGHGVGRAYHEDPQIPNFGAPGRGPCEVIGEARRQGRGRRRDHRGPSEHDVPRQAGRRARGAGEDLREDAKALHPHPSGRQGEGGAVAL